eukprot:6126189-Prymnesium_polylepis.1
MGAAPVTPAQLRVRAVVRLAWMPMKAQAWAQTQQGQSRSPKAPHTPRAAACRADQFRSW